MADMGFIAQFLSQPGIEGRPRREGYVPCQPRNFTGARRQRPADYTAIGASGVTIATGCDLGQTDAATLNSYGLAAGLVNQLAPYFGLKTTRAIAKLAQMPLTVSAETAAAIDTAVHAGYLDRYVRPAYDRASSVPFDSLPREAQAVIFSCCFQKGCGGVRRDWPRLWGCLVRQDWAAASHELIFGFRQYANRRRREGELLKGIC